MSEPPADVWVLVHPDGRLAVHNLPLVDGRAPAVHTTRDAAGALVALVDGAPVPVAYAPTVDDDAVTFRGPDGAAWTAFHAGGGAARPLGPEGLPAERSPGLYFHAEGQPGRFLACERPGGTRRPGARLRDQVTDADLQQALASARRLRRDDA